MTCESTTQMWQFRLCRGPNWWLRGHMSWRAKGTMPSRTPLRWRTRTRTRNCAKGMTLWSKSATTSLTYRCHRSWSGHVVCDVEKARGELHFLVVIICVSVLAVQVHIPIYGRNVNRSTFFFSVRYLHSGFQNETEKFGATFPE